MLNIVRRSQVQGLLVMDSGTVSYLGDVEEVWLDETGKVAYLSAKPGYIPLEQVADIHTRALSTYGRLVVDPPSHLQRLDQMMVQSTLGAPLGWVEDFLFDWQTGEVAAYILAGQIAERWGERVMLYPKDVDAIALGSLLICEGAQHRVKPVAEGVQGLVSEKSRQVQELVKLMSDRLHHLV